eukprot:TRINITY_DN25948_c0_g1_i1.p1 TRINITY_DN25948_c0_g1~~TRINITY_DN25948_c0_g1_i1.p1  ORF type:complete len:221 (-),score=47.48 TRINITY_DN25948_c0_g1_i1:56-718(-)
MIRAFILVTGDGSKVTVQSSSGGDTEITQLSQKIVDKIDLGIDDMKCYHANGHLFNYEVEDEACYFCVAQESCKRRLCFGFLATIKKEYQQKYRGKANSEAFKAYVRQQLDFFNNNPEADKIRGILNQVDEVKEIALSNIDKLVERGGRIEELAEMSEDLEQRSGEFARASHQLKRHMFFQNIKWSACLVISIIVCVLVVLIILFLLIFVPVMVVKNRAG